MKQPRCIGILSAKALVALLLVSIAATGRAVVDLTPTPVEYTAEGIRFQQLIFKDDRQKVSYDLPRDWTYRFDNGQIVLTPARTPFAEAVIQTQPLPNPQPSDDSLIIKALEKQVLSTLPPSSAAVRVLRREQNPVLVNGNLSFEFVLSYETLGDTFQRSVLFLNAPSTQLVFKLSARKSDFDKLYSVFRTSVLTLQWLGPV